MNICQSLPQPHRKEFLEDLATEDENWIVCDNSARHAGWLLRDAEPSVQPKPVPHQRKLYVAFREMRTGPIYHELKWPMQCKKKGKKGQVSTFCTTTCEKIAELGWHPREKVEGYYDLEMAVDNLFNSQSADFWTKGISELPSRWEKVKSLYGEYIVDF
ncbi:unnamed protein product [Heligmosomoides polygyrus]|uniref:Transposase n=1 Tax=Heligmosomoides polygyrus TaxID=6339 RepID=A0A183G536_HELPZ|nr:unnamed protein product [Heligmosomoides polygyrus]